LTDKRSWKFWLGLLLAASPSLAPLWLITQYGVNVHFWDEWDPNLAGLYVKAYQNQLTFADLISQHNEHRMLFPRLIYFAINYFTSWNNLANLWTGWMLVCIASACVFWLIRKTASPGRGIILWFLCNLALFTPAQGEDWLWGIGVANILPMTLVAMAVVAAVSVKPQWLKLVVCLILATATTFTNGNGFCTWPLLGAILFWSESRQEFRKKIWLLAVWITGFAVNTAVYFYHYTRPVTTNAYYTIRPLGVLLYFLTFCGNAYSHSTTYSISEACIGLGGLMVAMYLACVAYFLHCRRRGQFDLCRTMLPWLALGGFTVLSALLAAVCRSASGTQPAINSRYVTHTVFLSVALIGLVPMIWYDLRGHLRSWLSPAWDHLPACMATVFVLLQVSTYPSAFKGGEGWRIFQRQLKAAVLLVNIVPNNPQLNLVFPSREILRALANQLNEMGYLQPPLIATDNAADIRSSDPDACRGQMESGTISHSGDVTVKGWAVFTHPPQGVDCVLLTYLDAHGQPRIFGIADVGTPRDDIATHLNDARYEDCGWQATFASMIFPVDIKPLRISAWALDAESGKAFSLPGAITVQR
jgi:hypothetical protein